MAGFNDVLAGFQVGFNSGNAAIQNALMMKKQKSEEEYRQQKLQIDQYKSGVAQLQATQKNLAEQNQGLMKYAAQIQGAGESAAPEMRNIAMQIAVNRKQMAAVNKRLADAQKVQAQGMGLMKNVKMSSDSKGNTRVSTDAATAMELRKNPATAEMASQYFKTPEEAALEEGAFSDTSQALEGLATTAEQDRLREQRESDSLMQQRQAQTGLAQVQAQNIPQQAELDRQKFGLARSKHALDVDKFSLERQAKEIEMALSSGGQQGVEQQATQRGLPTDVPDLFSRITSPKEKQEAIRQSVIAGQSTLKEDVKTIKQNREIVTKLDEFSGLLSEKDTGKDALYMLPFGVGEKAVGLFDEKLSRMKSITDSITPLFRQGLPGAASERDVQMFRGATVSIDKPTKTNQRIIDAFKISYQNSLDRQDFMSEYLSVYGHLNGAERKWEEYLDNNSIYAEDASQNPDDPKYMKINQNRRGWREYFQKKSSSTELPNQELRGIPSREIEQQQEEKKESESDVLGDILNRFRSIQQGQTFSWGDEFSGGLVEAVSYAKNLASGKGLKKSMEEARESKEDFVKGYERELEGYRQETPLEAGALELAGAFSVPYKGVASATGIVTKAASKIPVVGRAIGALPESVRAGAVIGGVAGAGASEAGRRVSGGIAGMSFGSLFGGATEVIGRGGKALFPKSTKEIVGDFVGNNIQKFKKILSDKKTPLTLADVSDRMRGFTRMIKGASDETGDVLTKFLKGRSEGEKVRIADKIRKFLSGKNYFNNVDEIVDFYKPLTSEAYEKAMANEKLFNSKELTKLLTKSPTIKKALDVAYKKAADDLRRVPSKATLPKNGINTRMADYIKKGLDDLIDEKNTVGQLTPDARQAQELKKKFLKEFDKLNPKYAPARALAAEKARLLKAQEFGLDFRKKRPEEIKKFMSTLNTAEKEAAKVGVSNKILWEAGKATDEGTAISAAKRIIGNADKRNQLKPFFRNESDFNIFVKGLRDEIEANDTLRTVLKRLQIKTEDTTSLERGASRGAFYGVRGLGLHVFDRMMARIHGISPQNASMIANVLTDRQASLQLLTAIEQSRVNPSTKKKLVEYMMKKVPAISAQMTGKKVGEIVGQ